MDEKDLVIEVFGRRVGNGSFINYGIRYCGPDKRNPSIESRCNFVNVNADLEIISSDFNYYRVYKHVSGEPYYYSLKNYSPEKMENRLHRISKQFAKLYLRDVVPDDLKSSVKIVDVSDYYLRNNKISSVIENKG